MGDEASDAICMRLAENAGGLDNMLHQFFGFLHRRTDFYHVIPPQVTNAKMGFAPGAAKTMVLDAFSSYKFKTLDGSPVEVQVGTEKSPKKHPKSASSTTVQNESKSAQSEISDLQNKLVYNDQGKQIPLAGNGGVTERYFWTQTLEDLTIYWALPPHCGAKDLQCSIGLKSLSLSIKGENLIQKAYPDDERVHPSESTWSIECGKDGASTLVISLDKARETWWPSVATNEPQIDLTKVDSSRRVDEFDEETQAQLQKIMFDQQQKSKGLPTSDEIIRDDILEKAKHLPGSPFLES